MAGSYLNTALLCLFVCLDRALAQFPLWWYQVNGVQSSYCNDFEAKVELERVVFQSNFQK